MTRAELESATDEQLNEMAAKVMGWRWVQPPKWDYDGPLPDQGLVLVPPTFTEEGYEWPPRGVVGPHAFLAGRFSPATDIADAWELVRRLRKVQMRVNIIVDGDRTICDVTAPSGRDSRSACHASEARAITTAALLAWEAKENSK